MEEREKENQREMEREKLEQQERIEIGKQKLHFELKMKELISQFIRFARASSHVTDFNTCNKLLTLKLLKQGYMYHKLCKTFF